MSKISIILPAKNAGLFINETLTSIQNQSFEEWECICVDDHSEDETHQLMSRFQAIDNRFVVLKNSDSSGVISALQKGYSHSSNLLITRMDADDLMPEGKLKVLRSKLLEAKKGHVATGKVKYFDTLGEGFLKYENWLNGLVDTSSHWNEIYKECVIASPNWLIHRNDFDALGGFNSDVYPEDYDLVFRFYQFGLKVTSVSEVTHLWRDHESRASRVSDLYSENTFLPLKVKNFRNIDLNTERELILWGAGKKGKALAKLLQKEEISFKWITNNSKKIGLSIYDVLLENENDVELKNAQVIVAVSAPDDLIRICDHLTSSELKLGEGYFVMV